MNYYTNFCVLLEIPESLIPWAKRSLSARQHHAYEIDEKNFFDWEVFQDYRPRLNPETGHLEKELRDRWLIRLSSDESGDPLEAAIFMQQLAKKTGAPWLAFEYSYNSSRPDPDADGGGAYFITKDNIEGMGTWEWISAKEKEMEGGDQGTGDQERG